MYLDVSVEETRRELKEGQADHRRRRERRLVAKPQDFVSGFQREGGER